MSHPEMVAALDESLDALLRGATVVDLVDDAPEALELAELLATARLAMSALRERLCSATQTRHLRMLEAAAARWGKPSAREG